MRYSKLTSRTLLPVCLAVLGSLATQAHAQLVQLTDATQLNPAGTVTPDFPGNLGDDIAAPVVLSAGGNTVTFTPLNGSTLYRIDPALSLDFPAGMALIATEDVNSNATGPLEIDFSQPVAEFGLSAQNLALDMETFTFSVFDGATLLGTFTTATVDNTFGTGVALFLGAQQTGTPSITSVIISSTSSDPNGANFFAAGPVTFFTPPVLSVPEPSSYALLVSLGMTGAGFLVRRRHIRKDA